MEAYVERAIELGLREVGFSDHNPLPRGLGANVRMTESELDGYVNRVVEVQARYRGRIDVRLGLEMDYVEGLDTYLAAQLARYPWDYVIGSVHYLDAGCLQSAWPKHYTGGAPQLYGPYLALIRQLAASGLCDIIGHFDVPKRSGCQPTAAQADDMACTLQAIAKAGTCVEINTSGYRHPELPRPQPYPALPLVKQMLALGIPLMVNSDAHAPEQVGLRFTEIDAWLRRHGCRQLARFAHRQRNFYDL
jgi:histidinol-phosphatase (PHP family)